MFKSTLALLKSGLRSLRSSKKRKTKSIAPVQPTSDVPAEKAPVIITPTPQIFASPPTDDQREARYERKMGDSELSYYLPSRANGVNDMYAILSPNADAMLELTFCVEVPSSRFQSTPTRHRT